MAGITPLHFCIFRGNNEQAINLIESGECDLDAGDVGGQTPTHIACYRDNIEVVKKLVEAGADPTKADKAGNTPMHAAAGEGAMTVVKYFIERGVPGSIRNAEGFTPLELAERHCPARSRAGMLAALEKHAASQLSEDKLKEDEETRLKREIERERLQLQQQQQQPSSSRFLQPSPASEVALTSAVSKGSRRSKQRLPDSHAGVRDVNGNGRTGRGGVLDGVVDQGVVVTEEEAHAMAVAKASSDPERQALYRMLLRQHHSIDALTEVVATQANTIATLASMLGRAGKVPPGRSKAAAATTSSRGGRSSSANPGRRSSGGAHGVVDEEAIAEMVAYLDEDAPTADAVVVR